MSEAFKDGGPVHPVRLPVPGATHINGDPIPTELHTGKSLRDDFAGLALAGMLANPGGPIQANSSSGWSFVNCRAHEVAEMAYQMADDMIRAREKEPSS